MKPITREMIKTYNIQQYDFMGYDVGDKKGLSFHHLIVPHKDSKKAGIGDGYVSWNGAILVQKTSHDYAHLIQRIEPKLFDDLTYEMIEENVKGFLDIENLEHIRQILLYFESRHKQERDRRGNVLVKRQYITNRFNW